MLTQFLTIGVLMLLAVMLPGPDFAMVTKNTISHSRRAGVFTTLGIILSMPKVSNMLDKAEKYIAITLGIFLIVLGIALAYFKSGR